MSKACTVLTHRGLEPDADVQYGESSQEAFFSQLQRGFGLEFDFNITLDQQIVLLHDATLTRLSHGSDHRHVSSISSPDLMTYDLKPGHVCFWTDLAPQLAKSPSRYHAFHIKAAFQTPALLDLLAQTLSNWPQLWSKLVLFDLSVAAARQLKAMNKQLQVMASVSHQFDRLRYNQAVGGTLLAESTVLQSDHLYSGVWLDEWDLSDLDGATKEFITADYIHTWQGRGYLVGVVSPELHATSPGLLGQEAHPDASDPARWRRRLAKILAGRPDMICTDHPEYVRQQLGA